VYSKHSFEIEQNEKVQKNLLYVLLLDTIDSTIYRVFRQSKVDKGGSILSLSQFLLLPQQSQNMKLASKGVKIDSK
jgi:hypothetical protein